MILVLLLHPCPHPRTLPTEIPLNYLAITTPRRQLLRGDRHRRHGVILPRTTPIFILFSAGIRCELLPNRNNSLPLIFTLSRFSPDFGTDPPKSPDSAPKFAGFASFLHPHQNYPASKIHPERRNEFRFTAPFQAPSRLAAVAPLK
jgi:hypothetical protein